MLLLAVDTSSAQVSAAVVEVGADGSTRPLDIREVVAPNQHGELLAQAVHDVVACAPRGWADIRAVAVGLGPGPFTGLRVGVVTAAAISDARALPAYGVCSLDALAHRHDGRRLLVCSDARRRQVYWARYEDGRRVDGPDIGAPADVAASTAGLVESVVGAGALLHRDAFEDYDVRADDPYPSAVDVAALAAHRAVEKAPTELLEPLYLRRPDAVPPAAPKAVTPA